MPTNYSFEDAPFDKTTKEPVTVSSISLASGNQPQGCIPALKETVRVTTKRTVGLIGGISLIIGTMIGSGIFASAATVARKSGSSGMMLVTWCGAGLIATFGALSYAELGTMIPTSGGEYTYLGKAFGPVVSFMFSWVSVIVLKPSAISAICLACGNYIIEACYPDCTPEGISKEALSKVVAALAIGKLLSFLYWN